MFMKIMRTWAAQHPHGNASTADFEALATSISGLDLDTFFTAWVDAALRDRVPERRAAEHGVYQHVLGWGRADHPGHRVFGDA